MPAPNIATGQDQIKKAWHGVKTYVLMMYIMLTMLMVVLMLIRFKKLETESRHHADSADDSADANKI